MAQVTKGPGVSSWADASDDDNEEDEQVFRPVSDSESESDRDDEAVPDKKDGMENVSGEPQAKAAAVPKNAKKDRKKGEKQETEEDLDNVLAEFGIDLSADAGPATGQ